MPPIKVRRPGVRYDMFLQCFCCDHALILAGQKIRNDQKKENRIRRSNHIICKETMQKLTSCGDEPSTNLGSGRTINAARLGSSSFPICWFTVQKSMPEHPQDPQNRAPGHPKSMKNRRGGQDAAAGASRMVYCGRLGAIFSRWRPLQAPRFRLGVPKSSF